MKFHKAEIIKKKNDLVVNKKHFVVCSYAKSRGMKTLGSLSVILAGCKVRLLGEGGIK